VKGAEGWLLPAGIMSTQIVADPAQLVTLFERLDRAGMPTVLLVQEMIPAEGARDWIVHGYCAQDGETVRTFTGIKLRSYPAFAGATTLARCVENVELRARAEALFRALGYRGIMDLDLRYDPRDDTYKLLDFNPRVGAQFRLFEDERGTDVVRAQHLDLTGRAIPAARQIEGRSFLAEIPDTVAALRYVRSGQLGVGAWWRSVRGVDEGAWFALDDPAPIALMAVRFVLERFPSFWRGARAEQREATPRLVRGGRRPAAAVG
jgi:D-aspartate ligase